MHWIEIVQLRFTARDSGHLAEQLLSGLETWSYPGLTAVRLYRNATFEGDISVHLHFETETPPSRSVGHRLAQELERHGLTDRSLWLEQETGESED